MVFRNFNVMLKQVLPESGESYPLREFPDIRTDKEKGWAISEEDQREDAMLIHEIGSYSSKTGTLSKHFCTEFL